MIKGIGQRKKRATSKLVGIQRHIKNSAKSWEAKSRGSKIYDSVPVEVSPAIDSIETTEDQCCSCGIGEPGPPGPPGPDGRPGNACCTISLLMISFLMKFPNLE